MERVVDLETSVKNRDEKGKPIIGGSTGSPWWPDNDIVLAQWEDEDGEALVERYTVPPTENCTLAIGHNIKFDLLYLLTRSEEWREWWTNPTSHIWDTQLAEYIISGQTHLYPSLNECAEKYGGELKDDRVKEFWQEGYDTEDIPEHILDAYGKWDVINTRTVYDSQRLIASKEGLLSLIESQMCALMATIEMEYNGMLFAREEALDKAKELTNTLETVNNLILHSVEDECGALPFEFNIGSNQQLSAFLFGGSVKYEGTETVLDSEGNPAVYKSGAKKGKVKTRKCKKEFVFNRLVEPLPKWERKSGWSVDDKVLSYISANADSEIVRDLAAEVMEYRELSKDISTYYLGLSELVWPDGYIHGNLNHCSTSTGRLSSTQPNMQNLSKG